MIMVTWALNRLLILSVHIFKALHGQECPSQDHELRPLSGTRNSSCGQQLVKIKTNCPMELLCMDHLSLKPDQSNTKDYSTDRPLYEVCSRHFNSKSNSRNSS